MKEWEEGLKKGEWSVEELEVYGECRQRLRSGGVD